MDEFQTLKYRWGICAERKAVVGISATQILSDIGFLLKRVSDLERNFADAINPVSSRIGQATLVQDGILHYMVNGKFVPISEIAAALQAVEEKKAKKTRKKKVNTDGNESGQEEKK